METKSFKNWWFLTVNGLVAILFGLLLLLFTEEILKTAIFYFGILILITGVILLITTFYYFKKNKSASMVTIQSIASIAIGLILMVFPKESLNLFFILIGIWAAIIGILQLIILFFMRDRLTNGPVLLINGLLTILLGIIIFMHPFQVADTIAKLVGIFSIVFGITMIYLSFLVRKAIKASVPAK
jgi:uncharacterized membrane protein HdeD (DUF308 family)